MKIENIENKILLDFANSLYKAPLCTDDFKEGVKNRAIEKALEYKYIGLNNSYKNYIVLDLDHSAPGATAFFWHDNQLPPPTIIATNPENGRCHYFYKINTPVCFTAGGRKHPQDFYKAVKNKLTKLLGGDPAYAGAIAKNPLNSAWKVITLPVSYDLQDFGEWFSLKNELEDIKLENFSGRNSALFSTLSKFGHKQYKNFVLCDAFLALIRSEATFLNAQLDRPLPDSEVKATARSVGRGIWRWRRAHPSNLNPATLTLLQQETDRLKLAGQRPTQFALAIAADMPQKTVHKYLKHLKR